MAVKAGGGIRIRMSMMFLPARKGTAVLPMCSMVRWGTCAWARSEVSSALIASKAVGQVGWYSWIWISILGGSCAVRWGGCDGVGG